MNGAGEGEAPEPERGWAPPDASGAGAPAGGPPAPVSPSQDFPPVYGTPPAPGQRRTNPYAKAALAAGLIGMVLFAIGFAIAAFVQIKRRGEKGRGLVVGGLAASLVWIVAGAVVAVVATSSLLSPKRDSAGHITKSGKTVLSRLKTGDCFTGFGKDETRVIVTALPCTRPHDGEIVAEAMLSEGGLQPGEEGLEAEATKLCMDRLDFLTKSRYHKDLEVYVEKPDLAARDNGDRDVTCAMRYTGPGALTAPLATTIDPDLKALRHLDIGDCLVEWDLDDPVARGIPCSRPHSVQVYAKYQLPTQEMTTSESPWEYPGTKIVEKYAADGCQKRADKIFAKHPPPVDLRNYYRAPSEQDWYFSQQVVVCLVGAEHGTLRKSVLGK
ncbi:DUF4190 domain-containing protein [Actinomadura verrucosospora]|uniref:Septum formation-related domain-containing protein n=1 Tax=Actinomadura verrucosospora TaxID=46165 RepID=A0A7D3VYU9_ACTVE|nr:DUF4190 domain-containing protein [Actinomadura verrucosospora]QKG26290.1 hypothetical protein ACTIVE_7943 [Actinomadura verrucosospora]